MSETHPADGLVFPVRPEIAAKAHVSAARYRDMFERAGRDPDGFWGEQSRRIAWMKRPTKIKDTSFSGDVSIKWFEDGTLNASASCLDRHLATRRIGVTRECQIEDAAWHCDSGMFRAG